MQKPTLPPAGRDDSAQRRTLQDEGSALIYENINTNIITQYWTFDILYDVGGICIRPANVCVNSYNRK